MSLKTDRMEVCHFSYSGRIGSKVKERTKKSCDPDCVKAAIKNGHFIKRSENGSYDVYIYANVSDGSKRKVPYLVWEKMFEDLKNE